MTENTIPRKYPVPVPVPDSILARTAITAQTYERLYKQSVENPDAFWGERASRLEWFSKWKRVSNTSFKDDISIRWFEGGKLNVTVNCLDRHVATTPEKIAFLWEPDQPTEPSRAISYRETLEHVNRLANVLKKHGVGKGDRVTIYLPMIPEAAFAMLACARIGAVHSVVFAGFSATSLSGRIGDCQSSFLITADEGLRGGKTIPLKQSVDEALASCPTIKSVLVVRRTGAEIPWKAGRDLWYHDECAEVSADCPPEVMDAEDPLFILYTSGSTGKPKGVLHTTAGYLLYASITHEYVFDLQRDDIYWCTADVGWVTGHSYVVYGPLANGATSVIFEGVPNFPDPSRHWQMVDKYGVTIYYTAPTAIRALMKEGESFVKSSSRKSLRILGSVGEPINPEAWNWYYENVGEERCPIVDTWWQTETGGIMISPLPGATPLKPGSATRPFFGVRPAVVDTAGKTLEGPCEGSLVLTHSWPGQMRTVYGDHQRFFTTYFSQFPGTYFTGDGCRRDEDGYYWITGRIDDVINVSGHRIGTAEIESALVENPVVAEAAAVGFPHDLKGQGIYVFVTLKTGQTPSDALKRDLVLWVRKLIGPIAAPDVIQWASALPKTRSGKIMRRILRKIASNELDSLGDISTLADPSAVKDLVAGRELLSSR